MVLEAIRYKRGSLQILDQLALPHAEIWVPIKTAEDAWTAIRRMQVRGAPAIAIVAALSVAVEMDFYISDNSQTTRDLIVQKLQYLLTSRPTAVNLGDAVAKLTALVDNSAKVDEEGRGASGREVKFVYIRAAEQMLVDDVADNRAIGSEGAKWLLEKVAGPRRKISVMTHCNTGSLATAGYGTALGIVRSLWEAGRLERVYYGETRPYNQGSRLTGYELLHDGIPATLVTDSMAGALMAQKGPKKQEHTGKVEASDGNATEAEAEGDAPLLAVIVGADRVAANGDTANKIGTYSLSVLARHHGVAFVVAAPRTTVDLKTASGAEIVIEQRKQAEVTVVKGPVVTGTADDKVQVNLDEVREVSIAPVETTAWNPAFDVTPAELIDAIATDVGVVEKVNGNFDLASIFNVDKGTKRKLEQMTPADLPDPREGP